MAHEERKDFNAMLRDGKDMPKTQLVTDPAAIAKYGGSRMYFAPPIDYDRAMRQVPPGRLTTVGEIRALFARQNGADFTEPITAGVFVSIAAWACAQRGDDSTPWWRTLKAGGELNPRYPGGVDEQRRRLEAEGHAVIVRGRKNLKYYVKDFEQSLFPLEFL
ncbi:MAG: MGMT family protein [Candidatus Faecivicinus sp.]